MTNLCSVWNLQVRTDPPKTDPMVRNKCSKNMPARIRCEKNKIPVFWFWYLDARYDVKNNISELYFETFIRKN